MVGPRRGLADTPISVGFLRWRPAVEVFHGLPDPEERDHVVCADLDTLAVAVLSGFGAVDAATVPGCWLKFLCARAR